MLLRDVINKNLDRLAVPQIRAFGRSWPAYQVCGYTGLVAAILLSAALATRIGLSLRVTSVLVFAAALTFLGLVMATKIILGEERIIFYHHFIGITLVASGLAWLMGEPVLPYADVTVLCVGMFLAFGRVGCMMVGCCHGRACSLGILYGPRHAAVGFTPDLVGVRLFPIQAVGALCVFLIAVAGCRFFGSGYAQGEALAWFIATYGPARFCLELARWRPPDYFYLGLTQPQWTSVVLVLFTTGAELRGILPFQSWHVAMAICLILSSIALISRWLLQKTDRYKILHPSHVKELAEATEAATRLATSGAFDSKRGVQVSCTSVGIQVSASKLEGMAGDVYHYALSYRNGALSKRTEKAIADLILKTSHPSASYELIRARSGVMHLLIHQ
jgi:Prolipoprotein diacylglyceryl transferase